MATFLLTWNPNNYPWDDIDNCIREISAHGHFRRFWSCGRSKKPSPGDRFFVLRQKVEPRGIMASGHITSEPYIDKSTHNHSGWSRYVKIVFDGILNPNSGKILSRHRLDEPDLSKAHWNTQGSGIQIPDDVAKILDEEWRKFTNTNGSELFKISNQLVEGARQEIHTTVYERNPKARLACLEAHGYSCAVCGFNFEDVFGEIGKYFIHVHHVKPLSEIDGKYVVDPLNDLKPVCPNCHAILHRSTDEGFISIEDLRTIIKKNFQHLL
jgi:5-methylcytosine-specific restriction enzyme A